MRTIEVKLYQFDELSDAAKAKALDTFRHINVDWDDWHEPILDEWREKLAAEGFKDADIAYTGFWSQGDGASFTCTDIDIPAFLKAHKLAGKHRALYDAAAAGYVTASIDRTQWHHYVHENTITADLSTFYLDNYIESATRRDRVEQQAAELEGILQQRARELSVEIYRALEAAYDADTTDEAVTDAIQANEYEFTEAGDLA